MIEILGLFLAAETAGLFLACVTTAPEVVFLK